jgi:hypothetical protein
MAKSRPIPRRLRAADLPAVADALGVRLSGDQLRAGCVVHGGTDPNMTVWINGDDMLAAKCHSSDCKGILDELRDLVVDGDSGDRKPIERLPPVELPSVERLAEGCDEMRNGASGVLADQLANAGWADHREALADLGVGHDGNRLIFPIQDADGELIGVTRYAPTAANKCRCPRGQKRGLFPAPETIEASEIFLLEGEPDAITATLAGLPAVGVPGARAWRDEWVERFRGRTVIVCMDCDKQGRDGAQQIRGSLEAHGITVAVIDLDPSRDDGFDFKDYAKAHGLGRAADHVRQLATEALHVDTADLLGQISRFLSDYIVFPEPAQPLALALWVLHGYAIEAAEQSPYIVITAPEKRCGKSLLRDALGEIVRRPWRIDAAPTPAVLYRKIEAHGPTVLLDEADAMFAGNREQVEALRAIFNGGNRRGATVPRCVGEGTKMEVRDFEIFGPKALVGIDSSKWPDTIRDRSIEIVLRRKRRDESVIRFRRREVTAVAVPIRESCQRWATAERIAELADARPDLPDDLDDRAADGWEPLLAIADMAGGTWPEQAREAAKTLSGSHDEDSESAKVRLLRDIAKVFIGNSMFTADLVAALRSIEEAPWGDEPALTPAQLAVQLDTFGVKPKQIRIGDTTKKGYRREWFTDAFARYLGGPFVFQRPARLTDETRETPETSTPPSHAVVSPVSSVSVAERSARRVNPALVNGSKPLVGGTA